MKKILSLLIAGAMLASGLVGCGTASKPDASGAASAKKSYTASAQGMNGPVAVEVTFEGDKITDVVVKEHTETDGISDTPIKEIPAKIVANQTVNVDAISGATLTSKAILDATKDCIAQAGLDVAKYGKEIVTTAGALVTKTADVVIIGGGGAGMAAAVSAAENGASVIVIEKTPALGGNTVLAGGGYNAFDPDRERKQEMSPAQRKTIDDVLAVAPKNDEHKKLIEAVKAQLADYDKQGAKYLFDSAEWHALQSYAGGDYLADPALLERFANISNTMLHYLEDNGVEWKDTTRTYLGALWPRSHEASNYKSGVAFIDTFIKTIEKKKLNVEIIKEVAGKEFIMTGDKVTGVKALAADGTPYELTANKGVILATGGFAANPEMRAKYNPALLNTLPTTNSPAMTGDGIVMAEAIGANLVGMDKIQCLPVTNPATGQTFDNVGSSTGIFLNKQGVRFVNEAGRRDEITKAVLAQTDGVYYVVINEANLMADAEGKNKNGLKISDLVEKGSTVKADTLEELATKLNMDPAVVTESVRKFQAAYDSKNDPEFGRATFDKDVNLS
ncbi:MAG: FAD-dependent oxidoreductase, partial [Angelakisella sp.]